LITSLSFKGNRHLIKIIKQELIIHGIRQCK